MLVLESSATLLLTIQIVSLFTLLFCLFRYLFAASPPADVTAVQSGPTSILVSWGPSGDATGYMIQYVSTGGHSGNETVDGNDTTSWLLTGLQNGETYTISIVAIYKDQPSKAIQVEVILSKIGVSLF